MQAAGGRRGDALTDTPPPGTPCAPEPGDALRWAQVLVVWSCLALLPFGRAVEVPVLLMAAAGIVLVVRERRALLDLPGVRLFTLVFACMWLPVLASLPDAVNPERSLTVAVNHLRFLFAGVFMCRVLATAWARERLLALAAWLLVAWMADGLVQAVLGVDLLGREPSGEDVSGPFGAGSRKFGTTLAVFAPLCWVYFLRRGAMLWLAASVLASGYIVLAAGARAGWVSVLVCGAAFAWIHRARLLPLPRRAVAGIALLALLLPVVAYHTIDGVKFRVRQSVGELTGQVPVEHSPLGHRAHIWRGALAMIAAHPVNGVGARGFRYAFPEHAAPGDPFVAASPPILPTHSHQLLLEVAAETGVIGLAGLALAVAVLMRAARRATPGSRHDAVPYAIALGAAFFPLNTHLALYSAHWSQIVWWLAAATCGSLAARARVV